MARSRVRFAPTLEAVEKRIALTASRAALIAVPPGDTLTVLNEFAAAYPSRARDATYNPAVDVNHNGIVGQDDGRLLLRALPALNRKIPLQIRVAIAPADAARNPHPVNSGGATYNREPTIVGKTSPGALVFTGTGTTDLLLQGPVIVADAKGNFRFKDTMIDGFNNLDLQAVDRYGQQTLRAFPIVWLGFAQYENAHPQKK